MITEQLMKPGSFEVKFIEETPYSVRSIFNDGAASGPAQSDINYADFGFFGHMFVTPVRLTAQDQTLATLLAAARYTGVMHRRMRRGIGGWGLSVYFGVNDNVGALYDETAPGFPPAAATFEDWVYNIVNDAWTGSEGAPPYDVGTITGIGSTTLTLDPFLMTRRKLLDYVCGYFSGEYRVNPDNTIDAGTAADLFVTDPTAVVLPKGGAREFDLKGLEALSLDMEVDFEDLKVMAKVVINNNSVETAVHGGATFKDLKGNANASRLFGTVIDAPNIIGAFPEGAQFGHSVIGPSQDAHREVRLTAGGYDIAGDVAAGDSVYVYDPVNLIFDTDNEVGFAGQTIFPMKLRAYSVTWPIQEGMGIYYRVSGGSNEGLIVDLSDYVAYETTGASLEVGAARRPLVGPPPLPPVPARVF